MAPPPKFTGASAAFGTLPVLKEERELGFLDHSLINIGLAIATWAFLLGGSTALVVGARDGIYAIIIGNVIGVSIMAVSVCISTGKFGIEQFTLMRSVFGPTGILILVGFFLAIYGVGWSAVLSIMFGRAISGVMNQVGGTHIGENDLGVTLFAILAIAISWLLLWKARLPSNGSTALSAQASSSYASASCFSSSATRAGATLPMPRLLRRLMTSGSTS